MPRKLEAGLHGRYLMSSDLITSTMKSEPAAPSFAPAGSAFGVPTSAAATIADGRAADGTGRAMGVSAVAAASAGAAPVAAAPATAAPVKNLRRLTSAGRSDLDLRAIH